MAASLLLDTHALLWWMVEPEKLSSLAHEAINDPVASIFVSAAPAGGWDPCDRLLAAQAELEGLHLVSRQHRNG